MKTNFNLWLVLLVFIACKSDKTEKNETIIPSNDKVKAEVTPVLISEKNPDNDQEAKFIEFAWSIIDENQVSIGAFPYISAPKGMYIKSKGSSKPSKTNYTSIEENSRLIMYDGNSFFNAEGKKAMLIFKMKDRKQKWSQYFFDKSIDDYLKNIGARLIFKGQIPKVKLKDLNKKEGKLTVYNYIQGDPWNSSPLRHYVLKHEKGLVAIQVWSNSASGQIAIVELKEFKQTIKAPTASEIKMEIDKTGKAILNVHFDINKATLKKEGEKLIQEIYQVLLEHPAIKLSIEGHTDNTGQANHNLALSDKRASTVKFALVVKGIDIERLKSVGYGDSKPLGPNDTEENKAKNRRVELVKF